MDYKVTISSGAFNMLARVSGRDAWFEVSCNGSGNLSFGDNCWEGSKFEDHFEWFLGSVKSMGDMKNITTGKTQMSRKAAFELNRRIGMLAVNEEIPQGYDPEKNYLGL